MNCSIPPPLTEDQISAAVDGTASRAVRSHLRQCPGCAARVEEAKRREQAVASVLHRFDCPTALQLGELELGLVPPDEAESIHQHLALCARCTEDLAELRSLLAPEQQPEAHVATREVPQPRASWLPRIRLDEILATLLPPAPALALRGGLGSARRSWRRQRRRW